LFLITNSLTPSTTKEKDNHTVNMSSRFLQVMQNGLCTIFIAWNIYHTCRDSIWI